MNRGDVVLLVLWCAAMIFLNVYFQVGLVTAIVGIILGAIVFGIRLYLARRTFRN